LSLWEESFVPMRLAAALREVEVDGHPLVAPDVPVLPHRIAPEPADAPRAVLPWLAAGMLAGLALALAGPRRRRALAASALALWLLCGVLGLLMLFLWFGTVHQFAWANRNLLLFDPLALLGLAGAWRVARGRAPGRLMPRLLPVLAGLALVAVFLLWLDFAAQANARWIALMLPLHVGLWLGLRTARHAPAASIGA
jgi:hypothetical protein